MAAQVRGSEDASVTKSLGRDFLAGIVSQQSGRQSTDVTRTASRHSFASGERVIWKNHLVSCSPAGFSRRKFPAFANQRNVGALAAAMPAESVTGLDSIEEFLDADGQCKGAAFLEAPLVGSGPCVPPAVEKSPVEDSCGGGSGLVLNALDSGSGALNETWGQGGAWSDENKHRASASGSIANTNGGVFGALLSTAVENGVNPAQGASAKRPFCKQCQKPEVVCICATMPKAKVPNKTKLLVLQHYKERKHPLVSSGFIANLSPSHHEVGRHFDESLLNKQGQWRYCR